MALATSPDKPAAVRTIANALQGWVGRLGWVWVEGQVAQLTRRPGTSTVFLVLRDTSVDMSLQVTCPRRVFDIVDPPVMEGAKVVLHARPQYYVPRGTLNLTADDIRPVGLGELLARLEQRRRLLAAEGLFARERKRPLPFLPAGVGLVCGRESAAERDVVDNARRRWPAVSFEVENVAVQGPNAAREIIDALRRFDASPKVDVIVVSRGGGSVEDLLPFSDEGLIRAVFSCTTPVVSAIGHEQDTPLIDLVADHRASTPTDAGKCVVPDMAEEAARVAQLRDRCRHIVRMRLEREQHGLMSLRQRPVLADPNTAIDRRTREVSELTERTRRCLTAQLDRAGDEIEHRLARVRALSPLATLQRGYAVLQSADGAVLTSVSATSPGQALEARVSDGRLHVRVEDVLAGEGATS